MSAICIIGKNVAESQRGTDFKHLDHEVISHDFDSRYIRQLMEKFITTTGLTCAPHHSVTSYFRVPFPVNNRFNKWHIVSDITDIVYSFNKKINFTSLFNYYSDDNYSQLVSSVELFT
jgi:hypothetical protein